MATHCKGFVAHFFDNEERAPSVKISDRYGDNTLTLYRLRRPSGRPADYTLYLCYTGQRNDIQYV